MQSNNPVFRRSEEFNRPNPYGNQTYAGNGAPYQGYGQSGYTDPSTWGVGTPGQPGTTPAVDRGPMTIDSVVQRTAFAFGAVLLAAAATWILTPPINEVTAENGSLGSVARVTSSPVRASLPVTGGTSSGLGR